MSGTTLKEKLRFLLEEKGRGAKRDLAKYLGISPVYVTRYASDEYTDVSLPSKHFTKAAEFFEVSPLFFLGEEQPKNDKLVSIPVLEGLAGCGSAGMLEQLRLTDDNMVIDKRIFPADIISKNLAMIRIVGDSMQPYLDENDWAVVQMRNGADVVLTGAVYMLARGDDVQIKRCTFKPDGTCVIISDNQLYPIEEARFGEWEVLGKVVARLKVGSPFLIKE